MSFVIQLIAMPCGCVVDAPALIVSREAVECPWCGGTITQRDMGDWLDMDSGSVSISIVRPLVSSGEVLFEVLDAEYGRLSVRKFHRRGMIEEKPQTMPAENFEILRD